MKKALFCMTLFLLSFSLFAASSQEKRNKKAEAMA